MQCRNRDADVSKLGLTFLHCINSYAGPSCLHKLVHRAMGQTKSSSDLVPHESTYLRDSRLRGESRAWSRLLLPDDNWLPVLCGGWRVGSTSFTGTWDRAGVWTRTCRSIIQSRFSGSDPRPLSRSVAWCGDPTHWLLRAGGEDRHGGIDWQREVIDIFILRTCFCPAQSILGQRYCLQPLSSFCLLHKFIACKASWWQSAYARDCSREEVSHCQSRRVQTSSHCHPCGWHCHTYRVHAWSVSYWKFGLVAINHWLSEHCPCMDVQFR